MTMKNTMSVVGVIAKGQNMRGGKRKKLSDSKVRKIVKGFTDGLSVAAIAEAVGVSQTTVYNYKTRWLSHIQPVEREVVTYREGEDDPIIERIPCGHEFCPGRVVVTADHHRQIMADLDQEIEKLQELRAYHKRRAAELDTE